MVTSTATTITGTMPSTNLSETDAEAIEIQVLANINHGKSQCFVLESSPTADASTIDYLLKKGANNKASNDNDDLTTQTAISTEFDEYSLPEKLSFSSLYLADTGTFSSKHNSFDTSSSSTRPGRKSSRMSTKHASLLDLDDEVVVQTDAFYNRRFFGSDLSREIERVHPLSARSQSVREETLSTLSRADFYGGYSPTSNSATNGLSNDLSNYALSRSRFDKGKLETVSPNEFYRVSGSELQEPLSCKDKLEVRST